jgi:fibronectin-binding autotransporter adhesin
MKSQNHTLSLLLCLLATLSLVAPAAQAQSSWNGTTGNWSSNASTGWNGTGVPNGVGAVADHAVATTSTTTQDVVAGVTVGRISLTNNSNHSWTITLTNGITLDQDGSGSGSATISNTNSNNGTSNFLTFQSGTLTLADNLLISNTGASTRTGTGSTAGGSIAFTSTSVIAGSGNITIDNVLNNLTGVGAIRFTGGTNTFTGNVNVRSGVTTFTGNSVFGGVATNVITLGASGAGSATLLATNTTTLANDWVVAAGSGGTLTLGSIGSAGVIFNGTGTLNGDLNLYTLASNTNKFKLNGIISGTGNFTKTGTGTVELSAANTFSGITTVSDGNLTLSNALALQNSALDTTASVTGSSTVGIKISGVTALTLGGLTGNKNFAALFSDTNGYSTFNALTLNPGTGVTYTYSGAIANGAANTTLTKTGNGTQILSGSNTYTGNTTVSAGTLQIGSDSVGSVGNITSSAIGKGGLTLNAGKISSDSSTSRTLLNAVTFGGNITIGDTTNNGTLTFSAAADLGNATRVLTVDSGVILGGVVSNGSITKEGSGVLTLSANNTYSGGTQLNAGTVVLGHENGLGTNGTITLGGGTLKYGSGVSTDLSSRFSTAASQQYLIDTNGNDVTFGTGLTSSGGSLTKSSSGVLTLSGNNTYSGATTINAGTLYANGNIANSAVTINSGATLSGTSQIGDLIVNSGATVAPGASSANNAFANLSVNTLILNGGGNYSVKIGQASGGAAGTNWDLITVGGGSGSVTINAAANNTFGIKLNGNAMSDFSSGQSYSWNIIDWGSVTGFDASYFSIDTSNFGQAFTGTFSLANTSGYLQLSYSAGAGTPNWTGGSGNWSAGFGTSPTTGSPLEFSGASSAVATNNIASGTLSSVAGITFSIGAGAFTLNSTSGSAGFDASTPLGITESIINNSNNTQTINLALSYDSSELVRALSGNIVLNGAVVTSNSSIITFEGDNTKTINGIVSGNGGIAQSGNGSTILNAQNTYTGTTTVNSGTLQLAGSANLGGGNYSQAISNNGTFFINTTENQILSGVISGTGDLVKSNTGNLTLRGSNSYSGNTTINAGTVFIEDAGILGSASYSGSILNNGALEFKGTASQSLNGIISGNGGLTFNGSGTTTLAASNTYSGATVINSGTVSISTLGNGSVAGSLGNSSSAASNLVFGGGTLLATSTSTSNRSFTLQNGTTSTISVNGGVTLTITGTSALTSGSLVKDGSGTLTLSGIQNYSGTTTISGGNLTFGSSASLGAGNYSSNILFSNSSTLRWESSASQTLSGNISGQGGITMNDAASSLILSGNNSYSGNTVLSSGTIRIGSSSALGTGSLQFNGSGTITSTDSSSRTITNSFATPASSNFTITFGNSSIQTGDLSFSGNLNLNSSFLGNAKTFNVLNTTTFDGIISNNNSSLTKNGSGTLVLRGNNTYGTLGSTVTTLNAGTLQIGSDSVGSVGSITSSAIGKGGLTLNAGKISSDSSTSRTLLNAVTFGGNITIGDTTNNGTLTFSAAADLGGATRVLTVDSGVILGGVVSNGSITKEGSGVLTLSAANTYSGGTQLNAGTVVLGHADGLGSAGTITLGGGTLQYGSGVSTDLSARFSTAASQQYLIDTNGNNVTFGTGLTSSGGSLTKSGLGTLILGGSNTFDGSTTISAGNLSISSTAALASTSGITLGDTGALVYTGAVASFDRNISVTAGSGTIRNTGSGLLTLSGTLTKNGTTLTLAGGSSGITVSGAIVGSSANSDLIVDGGNVTLSSSNSYNGPTSIINGATLTASAANALPTSNGRSAISMDATGTGSSTLALGSSQSVASITGAASSNVTLDSNTLTIGTTSGNTTFAGRITGGNSSAIVKDGASTQILTGNNTGFTGTTTINSGTLQAAAAGAMGNSTVINVNGGSFLVTAENAVSDNTSINLGGGRMAMSGNFNENVGALTLSANSTIDFAGFSGILRFSSIASWAVNATLAIWNWSGTTAFGGDEINNYQNPSRLVFADNSLVTSNLNNIRFYSDDGNSFIGQGFEQPFSQSGFSGTEIVAVPEAESYIAAAILLAGYGIFHLRRRVERKRLGHRPA